MSDVTVKVKGNTAEVTPPIKVGEKLGFGAFSTASNVAYQFKSMYYLFFLTNVLLIDIAVAGAILTIGLFWDAINDPLIGFWAVNHKFKNGERCRPMALWFSVPWAISIVLLFTDFGTNNQLTVILAIVIYLVFEVFNTFTAIPYNSMGSLATNVDADRRSINVWRNLGGCLGAGIGAVACLPLLRLFGGLDESGNLAASGGSRGFFLVACVMGGVCIAGSLAHYFTTKERVKPIADEEEKLRVKDIVRMLFHSKAWILNTLYVMCYAVINLMLMSCITYYATYVMGSTGAATLIQAAYLVTSILASFVVSPIDKWLGRKKTMMLAAIIFILGKVWFILQPFSVGAMYVNAITVGFSVTITFVMFNTNRNNIVDLIEWKDGRRLDSMVSTADNLASKSATAIATLVITGALGASGFSAELPVQPDAAINTLNAFLGWIPMLVSVAMLVVVSFLNIDDDMKKMNEEKGLE